MRLKVVLGDLQPSIGIACPSTKQVYEMSVEMSVPALRSWNSADFSYPAIIANPRKLHELIEVVKDHNNDKYPSPLRVAAHRHSMTPCFATTGTQVLLKHFNDIRVDLDARTVTVGANVDMYRMRNALRTYGMLAEVSPEIGNAIARSSSTSVTTSSRRVSGADRCSLRRSS